MHPQRHLLGEAARIDGDEAGSGLRTRGRAEGQGWMPAHQHQERHHWGHQRCRSSREGGKLLCWLCTVTDIVGANPRAKVPGIMV